jgi:hypothetical protein
MAGATGSAALGPSAHWETKRAATSGNVTKRRFVVLTTESTVTRAGLGAKSFGIAGDTLADGVAGSICDRGETEIELGGTVAAGGLLMSDANGKGIAYATGGAGTTVYAAAYADAPGDSSDIVKCYVFGLVGGTYGIVTAP